MMWKKVISMLLVAAMLAMPIGCGKDGNKDKDTTSGVETTDIGDDSAETDAPPKTPVPKEDKETKESDKDTDTENETDFSDDDYEPAQVTKKELESMSAQDLIDRIKDSEKYHRRRSTGTLFYICLYKLYRRLLWQRRKYYR